MLASGYGYAARAKSLLRERGWAQPRRFASINTANTAATSRTYINCRAIQIVNGRVIMLELSVGWLRDRPVWRPVSLRTDGASQVYCYRRG